MCGACPCAHALTHTLNQELQIELEASEAKHLQLSHAHHELSALCNSREVRPLQSFYCHSATAFAVTQFFTQI
jgi:hypothetical protein